MLRSYDKDLSNSHHISQLLNWTKDSVPEEEFPYMPGRVVLQDFTGVPVVVDLASMRDAVSDLGMEPSMINPIVRSDLVIDHSVQVDSFAQNDSMNLNILKEFDRNTERYKLLKWAQSAFSNFLVVPPGTGIVHQVNLENLAEVILSSENNFIYPDTCIGTDSHTTMINAVGVLGWGVGGIEAEAVMLGQPYYMQVPEVVGVNLDGNIPEGTTATDLVLSIVEILREVGVVEKFVEFYGNGLKNLSLTDRATISNMAPEYGATCGFFPIDDRTIDYLALTGRPNELIERVETYAKLNALFYQQDNYPEYSMNVNFDLRDVRPSLAGPKRPQDKILLKNIPNTFQFEFGTYIDSLAALLLLVVGFVSYLVIVFSLGYMSDEGDRQVRYFAEISLFVGVMLGLVVANSFLLMFIFDLYFFTPLNIGLFEKNMGDVKAEKLAARLFPDESPSKSLARLKKITKQFREDYSTNTRRY